MEGKMNVAGPFCGPGVRKHYHSPSSTAESDLKRMLSWAPVAHACNPSYPGRDQKDSSLMPAWANSS
jgi:hypothetical protein